MDFFSFCFGESASKIISINAEHNKTMAKIAVNNAPECGAVYCLIYTSDMAIFMVNRKKEGAKNERQHILKLSRPCYDLI